MPPLNEAALLQMVRSFMSGKDTNGKDVTRRDVVGLTKNEAAYVGMALVLARPDRFLNVSARGHWIAGRFNEVLNALLCVGIPGNTLDPARLVGLCRYIGLYKSEPGKGGVKHLRPTPSPDFTALVAELQHHPAVDAFLADADEAVRLDNLPRSTTVTGGHSSAQVRAQRLHHWLIEQDADVIPHLRNLLNA